MPFFTHMAVYEKHTGQWERQKEIPKKKDCQEGPRQVCCAHAMDQPQRATMIAFDGTRHDKPAALLPALVFSFLYSFFLYSLSLDFFFSHAVAFLWRVSLSLARRQPHAVRPFFSLVCLSFPSNLRVYVWLNVFFWVSLFPKRPPASRPTNTRQTRSKNLRGRQNSEKKTPLQARRRRLTRKKTLTKRGTEKGGSTDRQACACPKPTRQSRE